MTSKDEIRHIFLLMILPYTCMIFPQQEGYPRRLLCCTPLVRADFETIPSQISVVKTKDLVDSTRNGPIVAINCHTNRCDAPFILPGNTNISHLTLTDFTEGMARSAWIR
ncbi:hypothetical protein B0J17DRAFT_667259 [Rhizoctonia solani]|nr:hypothetical protein B0J17DRAFT_667259 [Rhizoctonia solani]